MNSRNALPIGWVLALLWSGQALAASGLSEEGYFDALPVVLTVSRLEQPISDTPGAVTVIDRDTIRRSGARDVADLLRLVPGYLVSGWNGANPNAMYHAPLDDFGTRNLVLIDGRSVYSPFYLGDTHHGMMAVLLDDIERIEVLRGSNSAAYGANAMFGVINIITRHSADTLGGQLALSTGNGGLNDAMARIGWGNPESATYRLSAGRRSDDGNLKMFDNRDLRQIHFRGDWHSGTTQEMLLEAGATELSAQEGFAGAASNPERNTKWRDWYLKGEWKQQVSDSETVQLSLDFDEEHNNDVAPYLNSGVTLDFSGRGRRYNVELQHQKVWSDALRTVWGVGYKQDEAQSVPLYATSASVKIREERLFGNLEWRLAPQWLFNAGWFVGRHSWTGAYSAPRLMLNYQVTPDHTFRVGATRSIRTPTLFELAGDVKYHIGSTLVGQTTLSTGHVQPETLQSSEIGYFGHFRDWRLTLDVRAYHERLDDMIWKKNYLLPDAVPGLWLSGKKNGHPSVSDYVNSSGIHTKGIEWQARWSPAQGTDIWFNQNWQSYDWLAGVASASRIPPTHASTLALFQQLPAQMDMSLMWHVTGSMPWKDATDHFPVTHRLDLRLAKKFLLASTQAEAAITVQSLNGAQPEVLTRTSHGTFYAGRRAFLTLRLEY